MGCLRREERAGSAKGPEPKPPQATPAPDEQINLTDLEARLIRKNKREGYTQNHNAQAVVAAPEGSQFIVGQRVSDWASDAGQLAPGLQSIPSTLVQTTAALADSGYVDKERFQRRNGERPELDIYVSDHREDVHAERR